MQSIRSIGGSHRWNAIANGCSHLMHHPLHQNRRICHHPSPVSAVLIRSFTSNSKSTKRAKDHHFLTPGFQPTAIAGDNVGFYSGSTFFEGVPPDTLPILDASVILSPGRYCKKSSWYTSHHRHKGTKSGVDAAQRLVEARREFIELIHTELRRGGTSSNSASEVERDATRKIYTITGHGVPIGLLQQLIDVARSWLHTHPSNSSSISNESIQQQPSHLVQILLSNTPNSTLLDQDRIRTVNSHGVTDTLPNFPTQWEHDLEMFMVIMDRIGSRLASVASRKPSFIKDGNDGIHFHDDSGNNTADTTDEHGTGSIITPSQLQQWDVTIMKGEALPLSLLPSNQSLMSSGSSAGNGGYGKRRSHRATSHNGAEGSSSTSLNADTPRVPILTLEWERRGTKNDDWCNVILRLQDDGNSVSRQMKDSGPISLVFEVEYAPP